MIRTSLSATRDVARFYGQMARQLHPVAESG
jgi:hypothetical protein